MSNERRYLVIEPKKHWFLSYLKIWELITVLIITFLFLLGLYHKLDFIYGILLSLLIGASWYFLLKYSKNYEIIGEVFKKENTYEISTRSLKVSVEKSEPNIETLNTVKKWAYKQAVSEQKFTLYTKSKIIQHSLIVI